MSISLKMGAMVATTVVLMTALSLKSWAGTSHYDIGLLLFEAHPFVDRANLRAVPHYQFQPSEKFDQKIDPPPKAKTKTNLANPPLKEIRVLNYETAKLGIPGEKNLGIKGYKDGIYILKKDYWYGYAQNGQRILRSPFEFDRDDWMKFGILAGVAGGLLLLDEGLERSWQSDIRGNATDDLEEFTNQISDRRNLAFGLMGAYGLSEIFGWEREKATTLMATQSIILATAFTESLKFVTGRERPSDTDNAYNFGGPTTTSNKSFPSSHASGSFALASVASEVYYDSHPWVPWVAYPLATAVSIGRINENRHWGSDIYVGGLVGYFVGKLVVRYNPFLRKKNISIRPMQTLKGSGLLVNLPF